jgi:hypothetical protein
MSCVGDLINRRSVASDAATWSLAVGVNFAVWGALLTIPPFPDSRMVAFGMMAFATLPLSYAFKKHSEAKGYQAELDALRKAGATPKSAPVPPSVS